MNNKNNMEIINLNSITEVKAEDKFDTRGSQPFKVFCSDMNYYICKYHKEFGFPSYLFNEFIAARFLQIWNLPVPQFAFLKINTDHIQLLDLPKHYFDKNCFGSFFNGDCKEVDKFFLTMPFMQKIGIETKLDFLKIAMFDIWLCNEDRHFENFNLLFDIKTNQFVPIDHSFCFNTSNLNKVPDLISENESILSSPLLSQLFVRTLQANFNEYRLRIITEFKRDVSLCHDELNNVLQQLPLDWNSDLDFLRSRLEYYFSDNWLQECTNQFNTLFHLSLKQ